MVLRSYPKVKIFLPQTIILWLLLTKNQPVELLRTVDFLFSDALEHRINFNFQLLQPSGHKITLRNRCNPVQECIDNEKNNQWGDVDVSNLGQA